MTRMTNQPKGVIDVEDNKTKETEIYQKIEEAFTVMLQDKLTILPIAFNITDWMRIVLSK